MSVESVISRSLSETEGAERKLPGPVHRKGVKTPEHHFKPILVKTAGI